MTSLWFRGISRRPDVFSFEQVTFYNAMIMDDGLSSCSNALYIVQPCLSFIIPKGVATDEMT